MDLIFKLQSPLSFREGGQKGSKPLWAQNVLVLTKNFSLSKIQSDILNKGLSFVPTIDWNRNQRTQFKLDIQNYHRKIKLAAYFRNTQKQSKILPFRPTSFWTPSPEKLPPEINFLVKKDQKDFHKHIQWYTEKQNLSQEEQEALRELAQNKHIVIKPADKGSTVVILGRDQYIKEANRQLSDKIYYIKLKEPIFLKTVPVVHKIIDTLHQKKFINAKQKQYLKGEHEPRARRFYLLPKIHKDPQKWTVPFQIPPGRPIVSDCGSETYQTAEYIDYYLNPLSTRHPSYIKDTYHFISIIKDLKIPNNSCFFTIDIDSLYTNIDTKAGLLTVKNILRKYPDQNRPDKELLELLEINLTKNDFEFNGEYFLQIKGTAMGKKFSPAYANIFMADWEDGALNKCNKKPILYLRYLDDIFGIWTYSKEEFLEFINILDTHDPSIRLKYTFEDRSINFLDTTVYKGTNFDQDSKLDIKVYFKETDTHALLFKTSFHPKHTYKGLIKSQLIRFKRICTQQEDFKEAVKILFNSLRKRGYSRWFLRECLKKFEIPKQKTHKEGIPLITYYSTMSTSLNHQFKNNYKHIIANQGLLKNHQVISAYRRHQNLKDYLVRAKLSSLQQPKKKNILLGTFITLKYVHNRVKNRVFQIKQSFSPHTSNCIYLIFCKTCRIQYVGQTSNSILTRMYQHRYCIKNKREVHTPLVQHFLLHGWQAVRVTGIQSNSSWTEKERKNKERQWIYLLDTKQPHGLNVKSN
ncbi:hypothetical protein AN641_04885 [Candidatus Epulonipiscioides gigas]|nr:hypothetical protein AN641_04870 [Epulopiscium sp. SCG-C07WGA-EpuloA2]ONI45083.1 hypothetical protein AN641_04885 [Epulopiscium sp. SCG-C07WGA-EpuloA2]